MSTVLTETERVDEWRVDQFVRQGFTPTMVAMLIRWGTSPSETRPLIAGGCPLVRALRIVAPLDRPFYGGSATITVPPAEQHSVKV